MKISTSGSWLPAGFVPEGLAFQAEHWAPSITLNAI